MTNRIWTRRGFLGTAALGAVASSGRAAPVPSIRTEDSSAPRLAPEPPLPEGVYQRLGSARFRGRTTGPANISPSGRLIRSDEQLSYISIWETATGALLWRKPEVPNRVSTESTFSPDDQLVVLVSDEKGDEFVERYSPDGLLLASVKMKFKPNQTTTLIPNGSGLIRITPTELIRHDIRTGNPVWSQRFVKRRRADNMILRFSDDNQSLALLIGNHSAIYDLRSGHVAAEFDVFKGLGKGARKPSIVFFKALSREAKLLAFQLPDDSQFLHVLEIASGKTLAKVEVGAGCDAIFDPDASHLWVMVNGTIQVYSTATWKSLRTMRFRSECVMDLHFPSQTLLLSNDGPLELCNLETGKHLPQNPDPNGRVVSVRERSGGQVVANIGEAYLPPQGWAVLQAGHATQHIQPKVLNVPVPELGEQILHPNLQHIYSFSGNKIQIWDAHTHRLHRTIRIPGKLQVDELPVLTEQMFSRDGNWLAIPHNFGALLIDIPNGKTTRVLANKAQIQASLAFSPNSQFLHILWGELDGITAMVKNPKLQTVLLPKLGSSSIPWPNFGENLQLSRDSHRLALLDFPAAVDAGEIPDIAIQVYETATGESRFHLPIVAGGLIEKVEFRLSPSGRTLVVAHENPGEEDDLQLESEVREYEVFTGKPRWRRTLPGLVDAVSFTADGRTLITAHPEAPVYLWDLYGEKSRPQPKPDEPGLRQLWHELANPNAERAYSAVCQLVQHPPAAIELLQAEFQPVEPLDPRNVRNLAAELGNTDYRTRERAHQELKRIADRAHAILRELLQNGAQNREASQRLESLVAMKDAPTPSSIRGLRALEVLEVIGGAKAKEIVRRCSQGVPEAVVTREAQLILKRWPA